MSGARVPTFSWDGPSTSISVHGLVQWLQGGRVEFSKELTASTTATVIDVSEFLV